MNRAIETSRGDISVKPVACVHRPSGKGRSRKLSVVCALITVYLAASYRVLPWIWTEYEKGHPAIADVSRITVTSDRHPGDPINVAIIGSEQDLKDAMVQAGWFSADPLGLHSDLRIAADTVLNRPYETAPVSDLFLWGRREDLAFEQPVGSSPGQRHHVRFWKSDTLDQRGRPAWMGSATYDKSAGLSRTTGQITHHIAGNVDAERDHVMDSLNAAGRLADVRTITEFHKVRKGRNGGGDEWHTDGNLLKATISSPH